MPEAITIGPVHRETPDLVEINRCPRIFRSVRVELPEPPTDGMSGSQCRSSRSSVGVPSGFVDRHQCSRDFSD